MVNIDVSAVRVRHSWPPFPRVPVSLVLLFVLVLTCFVGPLFSQSPTSINVLNTFAGFSNSHWLGTDELGRDLLARVLVGGRLSLAVAGGSVVTAFVVGTLWGVMAASSRGLLDEVLMRTAEVSMSIPQILFALVCVSAFGASIASLVLIVGLCLSPTTARMTRTVVIQEMGLDYFLAGIACGTRRWRLMLLEVLPNTSSAILSQTVINAASAIILEASLSFVGLGVQPPGSSLGTLLQQGYGYLYSDPLYAVPPAVCILLTVVLLNLGATRLDGSRRGISA